MKITDFENYRDFLNATFLKIKSDRNNYSRSAFSKYLGFKAHNAFSLIMEKKRNLNIERAIGISKKLRLTQLETEYFVHLISFENCTTSDAKKFLKSKLSELRMQNQKISQNPTLGQDPKMAIIWILSFYLSVSEISKLLKLSESQINLSLEQMDQNGGDDKSMHQYAKLKDPKEIKTFFKKSLSMSYQSLEEMSENNEYYFNAFAISPENRKKVNQILKHAFQSINHLCDGSSPSPQYYGLNFQLFELSDLTK